MRRAISTLIRVTVLRYLGASVIALGADMGSFLALLQLGVGAALASGLAYAVGMAVHWWLSAHAVFVGHVAATGPERLRQQAMFVGSALVGLAITTGIVGAGAYAGVDPRVAKMIAVAVSFGVTYVLRHRVVFAGAIAA